jgi:zinc protease
MTALLDPRTIRRHVLPNGLTVLLRRDASAPVVAIVTHVKAGYFDETDDVVGIAHVLEHMYFKGTPRRGVGELAKQTKAVGGYLNAGTIYDHTVYYAVVPSSGFVRALDVQADAYNHSLIDADELGRELEVIIQEAKRKADNPGAVATETLYEMLFDRHRMRRWRIGREDGLRLLTRDDVVGFYRNFYRPGNTVLSVVGDVDPDAALREIEARYGAASPGEPRRTPGPVETAPLDFRYRELTGDVAQAQLAFGWRTVPTRHPDTAPLELLSTILGQGRASRLYRAVRERKLASSVSAYDYSPTEVGVFVVQTEGPADTLRDAARAAWGEVLSVCRHGVLPSEVERAQRIVEARMIRRMEDMEGQATHLAEWEALGGWELGDEVFERLMACTNAQVIGAAQRYLVPDQTAALVYRPAGAVPVAADVPAMRALLAAAPAAPLPVPAPVSPPPRPVSQAAVFEREEAGVRVYRTAHGVPVLVRRKPGAAMAHVGVFVQGGAIEETQVDAGLTLLMAHTALKGTRTRSAEAIAEAGERLGGSVNAAVGGESFGWSISVPSGRYAAAVGLLADVVQHAMLADEALERERATALAEASAMRDDMYRYPMRLALGAAYGGHPYGLPVGGSEASLRAITGDAVRAWHASRVLRSAAVVAVVGDADPGELAATAARAFGELEYQAPAAPPAPEWPAREVAAVEPRDKAQTALCLLFPGPSRLDDDRYAAGLVAGIASGLGGRFFDELREKRSLAYTVHAFASERRLAGTFGAYIATSPEREEQARAGLLAEFARFVEAPVTAQELADAQTYALGVHAIRLQRGGAVLSDVIGAWLDGRLSELAEFEGRVRAVTAERIQAMAGRYFDPARRVEGIVRGTTGKAV